MAIQRGTRLGRYDIRSQLGKGGMGEVYLAHDTELERIVALKVLLDEVVSDRQRMGRFIQEAKAASALNHPNILTIHEIGEASGTRFIATEFIDGMTLRARLMTARMEIIEALEVAVQVAAALAAAHDAGIVHRDIKPENIMLRLDGYVKVLDFGLAKLTEKRKEVEPDTEAPTKAMVNTEPGTVMGTVIYMSPEQARGIEVDGRSDIWSLGVTLYEMLSGRVPFKGETMSDVISSILRDEPIPLEYYSQGIPAELKRIVKKSLRKNKDERYQTVKDLTLDLKSLKQRLEFEAELERSSTPEESRARLKESQVEYRSDAESAATLVEFSSLSSQPKPPNNLSLELTSLVGREREIEGVEQLLRRQDVRLVTLTGVGGTGKTSLARRVASEMLTEYADGVFFIELSAINDPQLVLSSIAQPLGVKESGGKALTDILKDYLRQRQMLLVLDNFEQVTAAASQIASLLASAPDLKMLVTSRALLHLSAECEFPVPPLALPAENDLPPLSELTEYGAITLFVERARMVKSNFSLTDENARAVALICSRLEGLPLAIELAAARIRMLSPSAILARLESQLKLLTGGARDLPARQQTMRGAIAWSYDLLEEDEKSLLNRISIFAGGATLEAVEEVCSKCVLLNAGGGSPSDTETELEVLDGVTSLVDKSLLLKKEQANGDVRFQMLEVVREYAQECLQVSGTGEAIAQQHANYFVSLAEKAEPELRRAEQAEWLNRFEEEHDNIRAALQWSLTHDAEVGLRLAGAVALFWTTRGHFTEGRRWIAETLEKNGDARASARAKALGGAGQLARLQGDYPSSRKCFEECLRLGRETGEKRRIALATRGLGGLSYLQGDTTAARILLKESLAISRELEDGRLIGTTLNTLGELARVEGDYAAARSLYEEAVALATQAGNQRGVSVNLSNLGAIAYDEGEFAVARSCYTEALKTFQELGHKAGISYSLDGFAALAVQRGETEHAARLAGAAEALREDIGYELETTDRNFRDRYVNEARARLDAQAFDVAFEQGRALRMFEAIALALEIPNND